MDLIEEYRKQYKWRSWDTIYSLLPSLRNSTVLDIGCGIGDQARDLSQRGAKVIALDGDEELLEEAKKVSNDRIQYHCTDLREFSQLNLPLFDGLWISFTAAYFPNLHLQLKDWCQYLKPGGWVALIEADDILGHAPMDERAKKLVEKFYQQSLSLSAYDFKMGHKLKEQALLAGLEVEVAQILPDKELSFNGPATSGVLDAWKARLQRLKSLQELCGSDYSQFRMRFMASLIDENHRSKGKVYFVLARSLKNLTLIKN